MKRRCFELTLHEEFGLNRPVKVIQMNKPFFLRFLLAGMVSGHIAAGAIQPFSGRATFNGLFFPQDSIAVTNSGSINVAMTAGGKYTARLRLAGTSYAFSGVLSSASMDIHALKNQLTVGLGIQGADLVGTVSNQFWVAQIHADQAFYDGKENRAPQAGRYTVVFAGTNDMPLLPAGNGYATLTVTRAGRTVFVGSLADGTKVSQSGMVFQSAQAPFDYGSGESPLYCALGGGKGSLLGWLTFTNLTELRGPVFWSKPASPKGICPSGFSWLTSVNGTRYNPPAGASNVFGLSSVSLTLSLNGEEFSGTYSNLFTMNQRNLAYGTNTRLSLTFTPATGLFQGRISDPVVPGKKLSFSGVVMQDQARGFGYFLGTNQGGAVLLKSFETGRPLNDRFENRIEIVGFPATVSGSDVNATSEPGEPISGWGQTIWWTWTAPTTGKVGVFLAESPTPADMSVYTGDTLANLVRVPLTYFPSNVYPPAPIRPLSVDHEGPWVPTTGLAFDAIAGTTYQFQCTSAPAILGAVPVPGPLQFTIAPPPPNDNFSDRIVLTGNDVTTNMPALLATSEPFETNGGNSIWWSWTAPTNGSVSIGLGSFGVFTGENVNDLVQQYGIVPQRLEFTTDYLDVVANTTYQIAQYAAGNCNLQLHFHENSYFLDIENYPAQGTVSVSPAPDSDGFYPAGTVVTLTAIPALGNQFFGWSGSLTNSSANISVLMDRSYELFSLFGRY